MLIKSRGVNMSEKNINQVEEEVEVEEIDEELQALLANFTPESFTLGQGTYKLVKNYRDGFDYEATIKRYNDVLDKYDFIVGDWGFDQLRLKGFFLDDFKSAPIDAKISTLEDYIYEYCNFGCAYFVIQQTGEFKRRGRTSSGPSPKKNNNRPKTQKAHTEEKRYTQNKNKKKPNFKSKKNTGVGPNKNDQPTKKVNQTNNKQNNSNNNKKHQFTIRKKESE